MEMLLDKMILYFHYPFVRYALIVGVLIAFCSSLLGVTLVLKRFSFIGDGLSHVAFGAMAVAAVFQMTNEMPLVLCITVACAVLLLRTGQGSRIRGDAAIAMVSVGALAVGYLLMNVFSSSANVSGDVCTTLFGSTSILTLTLTEVWLSVILSLCIVIVFVFLYHKIFAVTFDESFAKATGIKVELYHFLIAVLIAVVIVLAMNLVGSLLISALVVFPALSAMRVCRSFFSVTICASVVSVICAVAGILVSILAGTPVGATIVAIQIIVFFFFTGSDRFGKDDGYEKNLILILILVMILFLSGCRTKETADPPSEASVSETTASKDQPLDLTKLSSTMVYSEVYNMMCTPEDYNGRTVTMRGQFAISEDPDSGKRYYACIIQDALACCTQGLEFVLAGEHTYPDDYPKEGEEITVTGIFDIYEEDGFKYCQLINASMEQ